MKLLNYLAAATCTSSFPPCPKESYTHRWSPEISLSFYRGANCTDAIADFGISPPKKQRSDVIKYGYGWCSSLEDKEGFSFVRFQDPPASYRIRGRSDLTPGIPNHNKTQAVLDMAFWQASPGDASVGAADRCEPWPYPMNISQATISNVYVDHFMECGPECYLGDEDVNAWYFRGFREEWYKEPGLGCRCLSPYTAKDVDTFEGKLPECVRTVSWD
ncbi:hypothetical protein Slin15195_G045770 [Septoria linicola]|uniref:Uncharacterized protein n=1 Tax=Septoria linicola TaxID=215465 RepID=A0A9Q9EJE8_9PEZI|nr:hypothetical protein Slin14017_G049290 [Septoria linicola]USW51258.1 hypothetical protein Slin15195_G045770 [Septoria linicola]